MTALWHEEPYLGIHELVTAEPLSTLLRPLVSGGSTTRILVVLAEISL